MGSSILYLKPPRQSLSRNSPNATTQQDKSTYSCSSQAILASLSLSTSSTESLQIQKIFHPQHSCRSHMAREMPCMANSIGLHDDISCIQALFKFNRHHLPLYSLQTSATLLPTNPALSNLADLSQTPILFTVVASWGLHSLIVYESDKSELRSRYGAERFRIAATKILEENPVFKGSILNNKLYYSFQNGWRESPIECTQDLSYFVLAALSNFEEKFTISPASLVERDQLHMVAIPYSPSVEVMELMNAAYDNGRHISSNLVCYKPVDQELTITLNEATDPDKCIICLDGSSWKVTGPDKKLVFSYVDQSFLHFLSL